MNSLQYKEESKCSIWAVVVGAILLWALYMDGASILTVFRGMSNIWLYVLIRDIVPAILVVGICLLVLIKKTTPKIVLILLSTYFFVEILSQFIILSKEEVYLGFLFTAENFFELLVNILAIVFTLMVAFGGLKASAGSLCVILAKGALIFLNLYLLSGFLTTVLIAALALFILSSIEDYEDRPLKKITGEEIGFERRNVGACVILTILTVGIYGIVWLTKLCKDLNRLHGDENPVGSEVLAFLIIPFYSVYWAYAKGKQMCEDSKKRGGNITDRKVIYLIMNLLFMQLFTLGFIQTQLNNYQNR